MPSVKNLRKIISLYNHYFKIKGIHKMRKAQLEAVIRRKSYVCHERADGTLELRPTSRPRLPILKYKP